MLDQAHQNPAGEVLVALDNVDVLWTELGHVVHVPGDRLEMRAGQIRRRKAGRRAVHAIAGADGRAEHVGRRLLQVPGALGGYQDDGGGAVVLLTTIEEVERFGDPARVVIRLFGERAATHHRPRICLGMVVGRHGNRPQRLLLDLVLVHEADDLGRYHWAGDI